MTVATFGSVNFRTTLTSNETKKLNGHRVSLSFLLVIGELVIGKLVDPSVFLGQSDQQPIDQ